MEFSAGGIDDENTIACANSVGDASAQSALMETCLGGADIAGSDSVVALSDTTAKVVARSSDVLLVGGGAEGESLQARFSRFKKERQRERALGRRNAATRTAPGLRDADALRARFVQACRSYLGVPYGRKGHEPDEPEYNAPLFLDCCGLVRRAVQDLQEDFGFAIGRWNQAYQFETLPKDVSVEQLKPGDLIFIEGIYFDEKKKPQRHNIVHVEVFIGGDTAEATIGSRWSRSIPEEGKVRGVQIHPSYKFISKNYDIKAYHFRSLDTWLHGTCRSTSYPDALALTASLPLGGKSVFQDSEAASGDEGEDANDFVPNPFRQSPVFYIGEGNNWKVVAEALESRGWRRLPFDAHFSTRFDLKWVEQRAKIDYKRHVKGQLVNHIPNNDVITNKVYFIGTMREHEESTGSKFVYHPPSYVSDKAADKLAALAEAESNPTCVWILKPARGLGGNGIELVQGATELRERLFPQARDMSVETAKAPIRDGWVIQQYVERPLLLAGRKFDMRAYCLVARTDPHLWFFHAGYCKVALEEYDVSKLDDRFMHLTNACVQKSHPKYRESLRGSHIWSEADAEAHLASVGGPTGFWPQVHEEMKRALGWIYRASKDKLERRAGYFDLWGVDFILDEGLGVHLLEVNSNPAMFFDSSAVLHDLVPRLVGGALDIVLDAQKPEAGSDLDVALGSFELIVDEAKNFCYS
eukprot:TRINITY_DN4770_c1_g1_i2.p1 TRINITY_DN4770_c1_g1~~TRINITY_DN4770_c1_g1_i2.p1  ORF type:complete len:711 (+),score=135.18 TRINITY_DN4770_c1_g1_i2:43-2133(+)